MTGGPQNRFMPDARSTQAIKPALKPKIPCTAALDFAPVTMIGATSNVTVVPANSPFKTIGEWLAFVRWPSPTSAPGSRRWRWRLRA